MQHAAQHQHHARDHGCCHGVQAFCQEFQGRIFPEQQVLDGRCAPNCKTCRHQTHCQESDMLCACHRVSPISFSFSFQLSIFSATKSHILFVLLLFSVLILFLSLSAGNRVSKGCSACCLPAVHLLLFWLGKSSFSLGQIRMQEKETCCSCSPRRQPFTEMLQSSCKTIPSKLISIWRQACKSPRHLKALSPAAI